MSFIRRVMDSLIERFVALLSTLSLSRLNTLAAMEQAEQQDELEERARRFEDEGKVHLAADLRARACQIRADTPGAAGHDRVSQFPHEQAEPDLPRIAAVPDTEGDPAAEELPAQSPNRRSARRRSCRRPKAD